MKTRSSKKHIGLLVAVIMALSVIFALPMFAASDFTDDFEVKLAGGLEYVKFQGGNPLKIEIDLDDSNITVNGSETLDVQVDGFGIQTTLLPDYTDIGTDIEIMDIADTDALSLGKHKIEVTFESSDYNPVTAELEFYVKKDINLAPPLPSIGIEYKMNSTLADYTDALNANLQPHAVLDQDGAPVAGEWKFDNESAPVSLGTAAFGITFVPHNSDHYPELNEYLVVGFSFDLGTMGRSELVALLEDAIGDIEYHPEKVYDDIVNLIDTNNDLVTVKNVVAPVNPLTEELEDVGTKTITVDLEANTANNVGGGDVLNVQLQFEVVPAKVQGTPLKVLDSGNNEVMAALEGDFGVTAEDLLTSPYHLSGGVVTPVNTPTFGSSITSIGAFTPDASYVLKVSDDMLTVPFVFDASINPDNYEFITPDAYDFPIDIAPIALSIDVGDTYAENDPSAINHAYYLDNVVIDYTYNAAYVGGDDLAPKGKVTFSANDGTKDIDLITVDAGNISGTNHATINELALDVLYDTSDNPDDYVISARYESGEDDNYSPAGGTGTGTTGLLMMQPREVLEDDLDFADAAIVVYGWKLEDARTVDYVLDPDGYIDEFEDVKSSIAYPTSGQFDFENPEIMPEWRGDPYDTDNWKAEKYAYYIEDEKNFDFSRISSYKSAVTDGGGQVIQPAKIEYPMETIVLYPIFEGDGAPEEVNLGESFQLVPSCDEKDGKNGSEGWSWSEEFSAKFNSPATFTAVRAGEATIIYETGVPGLTIEAEVTVIDPNATGAGAGTGDNNNLLLFGGLAILAIVGIAGAAALKVKSARK